MKKPRDLVDTAQQKRLEALAERARLLKGSFASVSARRALGREVHAQLRRELRGRKAG